MNRLSNNTIIKLSFFFFLNALIVAGCKEKVDLQKETYEILTNHYIKLFNYPNSGFSKFSIEGGSNTYVAFYTYNKIELSQCNDCGNPFIAFEVDPSLSEFNYTSPTELKNAHAIRGQTSSIAGPIAFPILLGKITGQKNGNKSWIISIELPTDSTGSGETFRKTGIFTTR